MPGTQATTWNSVAALPSSARKIVRLLRPAAKSAPVEAWRRLGCQFDPFAPEPDPARFFVTPAAHRLHKSLLAALQLGDGGLFLVTGEAGVGKTMLLGVLETALQVAGEQVIFHPDTGETAGRWQDELDRIADLPAAEAGHAILLVDGAEQWDAAVVARLEQLYETRGPRARAIRLVIGGRPDMELKLQRLIAMVLGTKTTFARLRLDRLDESCVSDFILNRLAQAGCQATGPFSPSVLERIARQSAGVPRRIIELCAAELEPARPRAAAPESRRADLPEPEASTVPSVVAARVRPRAQAAIAVAATAMVALMAVGGWAMWRSLATADKAVTVATPQAPQSVMPTPAIAPRTVVAEVPPAPVPALAPQPAAPVTPAVVQPTTATPPATEIRTMPTAVAAVPPAPAPPPFKPADFVVSELGAISTAAGPFQAMAPRQKPALAPNQPLIDPSVKLSASDIAAMLARVPKDDVRPAPPATVAPPSAAPTPAPATSTPATSIPAAPVIAERQRAREDVPALMARGDAYLAAGDLVSARLFYERAADAGNADAALMVGRTFDPTVLAQSGLRGVRGDSAMAATWYRRAAALGAPEAERLLGALKAR